MFNISVLVSHYFVGKKILSTVKENSNILTNKNFQECCFDWLFQMVGSRVG